MRHIIHTHRATFRPIHLRRRITTSTSTHLDSSTTTKMLTNDQSLAPNLENAVAKLYGQGI